MRRYVTKVKLCTVCGVTSPQSNPERFAALRHHSQTVCGVTSPQLEPGGWWKARMARKVTSQRKTSFVKVDLLFLLLPVSMNISQFIGFFLLFCVCIIYRIPPPPLSLSFFFSPSFSFPSMFLSIGLSVSVSASHSSHCPVRCGFSQCLK